MLEAWFTEYKKSHNIIIYDMEQYRSISEAMYHILKPQGIQTLVTKPDHHGNDKFHHVYQNGDIIHIFDGWVVDEKMYEDKRRYYKMLK